MNHTIISVCMPDQALHLDVQLHAPTAAIVHSQMDSDIA